MLGQFSGGRSVYILSQMAEDGLPKTAGIFEPTTPGAVGSVAEQQAFLKEYRDGGKK
jgi:hypothetical protein